MKQKLFWLALAFNSSAALATPPPPPPRKAAKPGKQP